MSTIFGATAGVPGGTAPPAAITNVMRSSGLSPPWPPGPVCPWSVVSTINQSSVA
jgi:hypothetical protein